MKIKLYECIFVWGIGKSGHRGSSVKGPSNKNSADENISICYTCDTSSGRKCTVAPPCVFGCRHDRPAKHALCHSATKLVAFIALFCCQCEVTSVCSHLYTRDAVFPTFVGIPTFWDLPTFRLFFFSFFFFFFLSFFPPCMYCMYMCNDHACQLVAFWAVLIEKKL